MTARGTLVLDLDGVLYRDTEGVDGAASALRDAEMAGWRLVYATNNSTKTADTVARHIAQRIGFEADANNAVTSAMAAAAHLEGRVNTAAVVGSDAIRTELNAVGIKVVDASDRPGAVVVGLDRSLSYDAIDHASRAIRDGARFIATNTDATYPTPTGLAPGAGTMVAAVATASGATAVSCGKPSSAFAELVVRRVGDGPVVIVGDRPETDIALGLARAWTTVLVLTGVTTAAASVPDEYRPDHVIASIADVMDVLRGVGR